MSAITEQLRSWGVVTPTPATPPKTEPIEIDALLDGIDIGDYDKARERAYVFGRRTTRETQRRAVEELVAYIHAAPGPDPHGQALIAGSVVEAISRMDPSLVDRQLIEELASMDDTAARITAVGILEDLANVAPADVPLGQLGRLALPGSEDWYVQAPAMALTKLLMLKRRHARVIVDGLSRSGNVDDRYAAADAVLDVAKVDPLVAPRDVAERLAVDAEPLVREKAQEALESMGPYDEMAEWRRWRIFGI